MKKTLLLTDIVNSTALTQQIGDERMSKIWIKHDDIARSLLKQYKAVEADRTDGFLMLFDSVEEACQYAIQLHMGFEELSEKENIDFKTRIGIHTGDVILIETSEEHRAAGVKHIEVEGIAKPTAARVMSIANGGQTLLTTEALEELDKDSVKYTSHGHWRMKGLAEPMELFETGNEATLFHPPQDSEKVYRVNLVEGIWQPVKETKHNLGTERDRFIGRKEDLHRLAELVNAPDTKLLTILGPGGTGKTRLSKRFGKMWLGDYPGGVWFCDLVDSKTPEGITSAVATALNIQLISGDPIEQLGNAMKGRNECLILLDNFEQITKFAGQTVSKWLVQAPKAKFIVTSRNLLNLAGEIIIELKPLPLDKDGLLLFESRAQERKSSFHINEQNKDDVAAIIKTLDGLPLAIELAAARIAVLSPSQIRERLKERFKLLTGKKDVTRRQQTLRAAIDWSWNILEEWEKSAVAQCSVFEGGFTLMAAEEVIDLSAYPDAPMTMDVVQALVDKSLLRSDVQPYDVNELWFGFYVSIQEYSKEKLKTENTFLGSGIDLELNLKNRHMRYFSEFGSDESILGYKTEGGVLKRKALNEEIDNLWSGLHNAVKEKNETRATLLLKAIWEALKRTGPRQLIPKVAEKVLGTIRENITLKAEICGLLVEYAVASFDEKILKTYSQLGLKLCKESGAKRTEAFIQVKLARNKILTNKFEESTELINQALETSESIGDKHLNVNGLYEKANVYAFFLTKKFNETIKYYSQALSGAIELGDKELEAAILDAQGTFYRFRGDYKASIDNHLQALKIVEQAENTFFQSIITINLGAAYFEWRKNDLSKKYSLIAITKSRENGGVWMEESAISNLVRCLIDENNITLAREYVDKAFRNFKDENDKSNGSLLNITDIAIDLKMQNFERANSKITKAYETADNPIIIAFLNWQKALFYYHTGQYQLAFEKFESTDISSFWQKSEKIHFYADYTKAALAGNNPELAEKKYKKMMELADSLKILPSSLIQKWIGEIQNLMQDKTIL